MLVVLVIAAILIVAGLYLIARGRRTTASPFLAERHTVPSTQTAAESDAAPQDVFDPAPLPDAAAPDDTRPDDPALDHTVLDRPILDRPVLDHTVLDRLRSVDDDDVLAALIDSFLRGGPEQLDAIEAALSARDPLTGLATLGLFRTSARLLGASDVEHCAGRLQAALEAGDSDAAHAFLQDVLDAFDAAAGALRALPSAA